MHVYSSFQFPVLHAKLQLAHQWLSAPGPIDIQDLCNRIVLDYVGEAALDVQYDALKDKDPVVLKVSVRYYLISLV